MRRNLLVLFTALAFAFSGTLAVAQEDNSGPNCSELNSPAEVRQAANDYGADTYDDDGDGFACESQFPPEGVELNDDPEMTPSEKQPDEDDAGDGGTVSAPVRVDTGGGYCATHNCSERL